MNYFQYKYEGDFEKREKVPIFRFSGYYDYLDKGDLYGDMIPYEKLIDFLERVKKKAQERYPDDNYMSIILTGMNYGELRIEYYTGRLETDKEFEERIKDLEEREEEKKKSERENDIKKLEKLAKKCNYKLEKNEE